jgi:hypothetical protein
MTQPDKGVCLEDLHVIVCVGERGEDAYAAARAIDDAFYLLGGRDVPDRVITVDDQTGTISLDTPTGDHRHDDWMAHVKAAKRIR